MVRRYFMSYYHRYGREMYRHDHRSNDCVCDTVKDIIRAQNKVKDDNCSTGCDSAIEKLRRPGHEHGPRYTTIPFVLYSKGTSKPFIGSGVFKNPGHKQSKSFFGCVETPVFRAKKFIRHSNCCVQLELLAPASNDYNITGYCMNHANSACSFFPEKDPVTGFFATGICITVDLNNFMGITCLDPINPM